MKKVIISIGLMIAGAILGIVLGYQSNDKLLVSEVEERVYAQAIISYEGFDDVLENADVIVTGTINSINVHDSYDEYIVSVDDVAKGEAENNLSIRNYLYSYTYANDDMEKTGSTNLNYEVGKSYIFVLQHIENVYENIYTILSDVYIPMENIDKGTILSEAINCDNCGEYINKYDYKSEKGKGEELSIDYIKSSDENKILEQSTYIAKLEIQELLRSTDVVDVYICSVIESIKGNITTMQANQIIIPFFKNTVKEGKNYIVCLDSQGEDSIIYTLSSKNSVIEEKQTERIKNKIRR